MRLTILVISLFFMSCSYKNYMICNHCKISNSEDLHSACGSELVFEVENTKAFSPISGKVTQVGELMGNKFVMIERDSIKALISGLNQVYVTSGSQIRQTSLIGSIAKDSVVGRFMITFKMTSKGLFIHPYNLERILKNKAFVNNLSFKTPCHQY